MIEVYDDAGEPIRLPTIKEVCPRCHGNGKHINPSIDGHGIPADDECWDDDDFREMYFGGGYDVTCEECGGANVVDVIDESRCTPEQIAAYWRAVQDDIDDRHTCYMESRGWEQ